jgi:uncharacterized Zn-finger protein
MTGAFLSSFPSPFLHSRLTLILSLSDASFVRQHDLRRHERIHSGNKPFPCPWFGLVPSSLLPSLVLTLPSLPPYSGKGFARGDALARHRARGICSGSIVPRRI